ncbi:dethiobiotin synthase [Pseudodesulfovibrio sp. F-1]|uniref:ATP-dependent dethiobiotin synthetase BioD n=1 Tax=Pseudodesulfovibrio alkaliphilus TaxID=2661613 RepID=A0A7K1KRB1_9BACT|nr:dethiobiotin synthase [Pseudodesulfovibrio alkaliphilus]MUM78624.1 dethiobiotin synthase [Pseudodesulfovibrio alkaliphilus]
MERYFISGTNTGVGKTIFSAWLSKRLLAEGKRVTYVKPVQTGFPADDDAAFVRAHAGLAPGDARVIMTGTEPVAPCFLWETFPFDAVANAINDVAGCDALLVEGAGGLLVPLDMKRQMFEIARACDLRTILVVPNRLGCINDAQLSVRFLASEGLPLAGLAVNDHYASDTLNRERNKRMLDHLLPGSVAYEFGTLTG